MRTNVRINDDLLKRAKRRATDEGGTLTSLVEDRLLLVLSKAKARCYKRIELQVHSVFNTWPKYCHFPDPGAPHPEEWTPPQRCRPPI